MRLFLLSKDQRDEIGHSPCAVNQIHSHLFLCVLSCRVCCSYGNTSLSNSCSCQSYSKFHSLAPIFQLSPPHYGWQWVPFPACTSALRNSDYVGDR